MRTMSSHFSRVFIVAFQQSPKDQYILESSLGNMGREVIGSESKIILNIVIALLVVL